MRNQIKLFSADFCRVVIEALNPLDPQRQCHRLINGVLVERTVGQVLPALSVNYEKVAKK